MCRVGNVEARVGPSLLALDDQLLGVDAEVGQSWEVALRVDGAIDIQLLAVTHLIEAVDQLLEGELWKTFPSSS